MKITAMCSTTTHRRPITRQQCMFYDVMNETFIILWLWLCIRSQSISCTLHPCSV